MIFATVETRDGEKLVAKTLEYETFDDDRCGFGLRRVNLRLPRIKEVVAVRAFPNGICFEEVTLRPPDIAALSIGLVGCRKLRVTVDRSGIYNSNGVEQA